MSELEGAAATIEAGDDTEVVAGEEDRDWKTILREEGPMAFARLLANSGKLPQSDRSLWDYEDED